MSHSFLLCWIRAGLITDQSLGPGLAEDREDRAQEFEVASRRAGTTEEAVTDSDDAHHI